MLKDCMFLLETSILALLKIAGIKTWSLSKREVEMILKELQNLFSKLQENAIDWVLIIDDFEIILFETFLNFSSCKDEPHILILCLTNYYIIIIMIIL